MAGKPGVVGGGANRDSLDSFRNAFFLVTRLAGKLTN